MKNQILLFLIFLPIYIIATPLIQSTQLLFNVERTNSSTDDIGSKLRNAWYTQVSGRPFAYDVVVYNKEMTVLYPINKVVVKIELYIKDSHTIIDTHYGYFDYKKSRIHIKNISIKEAAKDARFKVTILTDSNANLITRDCSKYANNKSCYNSISKTYTSSTYAKDNFSIRPAGYHYTIAFQSDTPLIENTKSNHTNIHLAAGKRYTLTVKALRYDENNSNIMGYTSMGIEGNFIFNLNKTACTDTQNYKKTLHFVDGIVSTTFEINQTSQYRLNILDQNWTKVDQDAHDCLTNSSTISQGINDVQGCNITSEMILHNTSYIDQTIYTSPHHFEIKTISTSNPKNLDVIYMHTLSSNDIYMSKQIDINITAKSAKNKNLSNFTTGCMASTLDLNLYITSSPSLTRIKDTNKKLHYLHIVLDKNATHSIQQEKTIYPSAIEKTKFKKNQKGTAKLTINYNIDRSKIAASNPTTITIKQIQILSPSNVYTTYKKMIPMGKYIIPISTLFLYARVSASTKSFQSQEKSSIPIPQHIDIYCLNSNNTCIDMNNTAIYGRHTSQSSTGWWLASYIRNIPSNTASNITLRSDNNLTITNGTHFILPKAINTLTTITCPKRNVITSVFLDTATSSWLIYNNSPYFRIRCTGVSSWAGKGNKGYVLDGVKQSIAASVQPINRLSW